MNDIEMRRFILQYAYDHRYEIETQIVCVKDMDFLRGKDKKRIIQNVGIIRDQGLIKIWDSGWELISIETDGVLLIENPKELERRFPVKYNLPAYTKQLVDTLEDMLALNYITVFNQFKKAQYFLFEHKPPDYLNSVKEAVSAVEGITRILCNEPKKTLSNLIPILKQKHLSHPAMSKIFDAIYAVRSDEPGAAHAANETSSFEYKDAEFILNVSASIIIYLIRQSNN